MPGLNLWNTASIELENTFQISATAASMGTALFMPGYAVGSVVENYASAKKGYRMGGLLGLILMVIGSFIIPFAPNYVIVLMGRFLQEWGILWLIGVNSSVAWFPANQRGLVSSLIGASLVIGIGTGSLFATILINIVGTWQGAFGVPFTNATIGALPMDVLGNQKAANDMFVLTILVGIGAGGLIAPVAANYFAEQFGWLPAYICFGVGTGIATLISFILPKFQIKKEELI
jgi:MFS family permease